MEVANVDVIAEFVSNLAFFGFLVSCAAVGLILVAELGVAMGVLKRGSDRDEDS